MKAFTPTHRYKTLAEVPIEEFANKGIRGVLLDIDNTLIRYGDHDAIPPENIEWLKRASAVGVKVLLYSNASQWKISHIKKLSGLPAVPKAYKPSWHMLSKALSIMEIEKKEALMIGDQLCTDIFGGNLCGIETVLVEPMCSNDWIGTKLLRLIEWIFLPDRRPWNQKPRKK